MGKIQAFKTMRTLRALRPLRAMAKMQGMRVRRCVNSKQKQSSKQMHTKKYPIFSLLLQVSSLMNESQLALLLLPLLLPPPSPADAYSLSHLVVWINFTSCSLDRSSACLVSLVIIVHTSAARVTWFFLSSPSSSPFFLSFLLPFSLSFTHSSFFHCILCFQKWPSFVFTLLCLACTFFLLSLSLSSSLPSFLPFPLHLSHNTLCVCVSPSLHLANPDDIQ